MTRSPTLLAALPLLAALACGDDDVADPDAGPDSADAAAPDAAPACPRDPAPADRARKVVIGHPFDADGNKANVYAVWELSTAGELAPTDARFEMGRSATGTIELTPDGEVGIAAQEDGTLGVFGWNEAGEPVVIHAALAGEFYAASVVIDPSGDYVYVLDTQWRENGGGIYRLRIGCDGTLSDETRLVAGKLPAALVFQPGDPSTALVAADDVLDSPLDLDAHLLQWTPEPAWLDGADGFPDDEAIIGSAAVTPDGKFFLIGDNSGFSGVPNRIAAIEIAGDDLIARQVVTPIEDPYALVASPFGDAVLIVSGFGDALLSAEYHPDVPSAPLGNPTELGYQGAAPQLPGKAVLIDRGSLRGLVLVSENTGVRRVEFRDGGAVVDLGVTSAGSGLDKIVGGIGVQP